MNMRPQHITITSIKYLISYPINMKVSNQVFTTSNSNKCVGGLYLCMYVFISVRARDCTPHSHAPIHIYPCTKGSGKVNHYLL